MKPDKTVHSNRTIMFAELAKVMNYGIENDNFVESLYENVINKATQSGITKTTRLLKNLYDFDLSEPGFIAFRHFWNISGELDRPILAILYAIGKDYLLAESIPVLYNIKPGEKVSIEQIEYIIESQHPRKYSNNTKRSSAQNIASSWKQAGFITGKVKNIRTQPDINYQVVGFALLLAYLNGIRGDFMLKSNWVNALFLDENTFRSLAIEAGKRDLLQYQFAGNVTSITFNNLLHKLYINGFEN